MPTGLSAINRALNLIPRRAEQRAVAQLRDTFVDSGVAATLEAVDHQLIYGRRGTGKTHALSYLAAEVELRGDMGVYVDLRTVGSPDGLFVDDAVPATERAARLLVDLLGEVHHQLRRAALEQSADRFDELLLPALDRLVEAITTVQVVGDVEIAQEGEHGSAARDGLSASATLGMMPTVRVGFSAADETSERRLRRETRKGAERLRLNFGDVARALRDVARALQGRLWLLLDEWSSIPLGVQPLLGEFLVRCVLPLPGVTVKIASLEQHTNFRADLPGGTIGLEVGADITANVDLDEFMVFDQNEDRARAFFASLLFKHLAVDTSLGLPSEGDLLDRAFATPGAFDELVRASEGVPRDAINIAAKAAADAGTRAIGVGQVRKAARAWYQSDKVAPLRNRADVRRLLNWIVDQVNRQRHARGFLVNQRDVDSPLLRMLFDARVLHLIRRGYLYPQEWGERYDLWVVDYGAYIDLVGTAAEPEQLLPTGSEAPFVAAAVLDFDEYTQQPPPILVSPALGQLLPPRRSTPELGMHADWGERGSLRVPVAIEDQPFHQRLEPLWLNLSGAAGHVAVCGGPQSGKSTLLQTLILSMALTHTPDEAGFYCVDFGGGLLVRLAELPHIGHVAARLDPDAVRPTVSVLTRLLDEREATFLRHGIDSVSVYRRLRSSGAIPTDGYPADVFLVVDGWGTFAADHPDLAERVDELAARGLGFGIHLVVGAIRWADVRSPLRHLIQTRLELRLGDPHESKIDRIKAINVPPGRPGAGLSPDGLHMVAARPFMAPIDDDADEHAAVRALVDGVKSAWSGPTPPPPRILPRHIGLATLTRPDGDASAGIVIGVAEDNARPVRLDLETEPHLVVSGSSGAGKSNLLRVVLHGILQQRSPEQASVYVVDSSGALLDSMPGSGEIEQAASRSSAMDMLQHVATVVSDRLPSADVTPDQLRNRTWWNGPDIYVLVDGYDAMAGAALAPLADGIIQARDVGLHLLVTAQSILSVSSDDPVLNRLREAGSPALALRGTRGGPPEWSDPRAVSAHLPPGRGVLIQRRFGRRVVQIAQLDPE